MAEGRELCGHQGVSTIFCFVFVMDEDRTAAGLLRKAKRDKDQLAKFVRVGT